MLHILLLRLVSLSFGLWLVGTHFGCNGQKVSTVASLAGARRAMGGTKLTKGTKRSVLNVSYPVVIEVFGNVVHNGTVGTDEQTLSDWFITPLKAPPFLLFLAAFLSLSLSLGIRPKNPLRKKRDKQNVSACVLRAQFSLVWLVVGETHSSIISVMSPSSSSLSIMVSMVVREGGKRGIKSRWFSYVFW